MKSTAFASLSTLALLAACGAAGCSAGDEKTVPIPEDGYQPEGGAVLGDFVMHVQPKLGKATIYRVDRAFHEGVPLVGAQAFGDLKLCQDGVEGSSDPTKCGYDAGTQTVELVTDDASITNTYQQSATATCPANSFCANVTLNSFWTSLVSNTYVQVTAVVDAGGNSLFANGPTNSDSPPSGVTLPSARGQWRYTSAISTNPGVTAPASTAYTDKVNGSPKPWVFANPDNADTYIKLKVIGAVNKYQSYQVNSGIKNYIDACSTTSGTALTINSAGVPGPPYKTSARVDVVLPFDFTFYNTTYKANTDRVYFTKFGALGFTSTLVNSGSNVSFPNSTASATKPMVAAWWDDLVWAADSTNLNPGLCARLYGSYPNRQVAISWKSASFSGQSKTGPWITFGVVLNEGSDEIWINYYSQSGTGNPFSATYGAQDPTGMIAATNSGANVTAFPLLPFNTQTQKVLTPLP
jgi:hypothetical protein